MIRIDMEIPKSCADCKCTFDSYDGSTMCALGAHRIDWYNRPSDCPLKEADDNSVLEQIRVKIDAESAKSFGYPNWERAKALEWALSVIDKCKAESEE